MSEVTRYYPDLEYGELIMIDSYDGDYVKHSDYTALAAERDALRAQLSQARNEALDEAIDAVHMECWTDGGEQVTPELIAEQATTSLAITAIRDLKSHTPTEEE